MAMEPWQIEALAALLNQQYLNASGSASEVSPDRLYLSSAMYGKSRWHLATHDDDGSIVVDQNDLGNTYQQRVTFEEDEVEPLLRTLLSWHLDAARASREQK